MPLNGKTFQFQKFNDDNVFETFCIKLWSRMLSINFDKYGRRGQKQSGVDLLGLDKNTRLWTGIQCKVRRDSLILSDITSDIEAAKTLNPKLDTLIIATTASRDNKLQDKIRILQEQHYAERLFGIKIAFWDDIEEELNKESNADLAKYCFEDYAVAKIQFKNLSLGRVLTLSIGIGGKNDTGYELLIGKIADSENGISKYGLNYWKGSYFVVNLNARLMETFRLPVSESDLEQAFPFCRDNFIITKWLNSIKDIDEIIKCDCQENMVFHISKEEYSEWLKQRNC